MNKRLQNREKLAVLQHLSTVEKHFLEGLERGQSREQVW